MRKSCQADCPPDDARDLEAETPSLSQSRPISPGTMATGTRSRIPPTLLNLTIFCTGEIVPESLVPLNSVDQLNGEGILIEL